jgi:phosphocarrier protein
MSVALSEKLQIVNKLGLHTRAAAAFVRLASQFVSEVKLIKNRKAVDGKSIMGILMLAAGQGCKLTLEISGPDQDKAFAELKALIQGGFGER